MYLKPHFMNMNDKSKKLKDFSYKNFPKSNLF